MTEALEVNNKKKCCSFGQHFSSIICQNYFFSITPASINEPKNSSTDSCSGRYVMFNFSLLFVLFALHGYPTFRETTLRVIPADGAINQIMNFGITQLLPFHSTSSSLASRSSVFSSCVYGSLPSLVITLIHSG